MRTLTWTCHVCGDERPDEAISVHKNLAVLGGITITQNIRYCNDRPGCAAGAPDVSFLPRTRGAEVSWKLIVVYQRADDLDDEIEKVVGTPSVAAGTWLATGERDLEFPMPSEADAEAAAARVADAFGDRVEARAAPYELEP
jgi:hypothetical protein